MDGFVDGYPVCFGVSAVNPIGQGPIDAYFPGGPCTGGVNMPDVPLEPTNPIAFPRSGSAEVLWTPPSLGKMLNQPLHSAYPITSYRVIATPGDISVSTDTVPIQNTDMLHATVPGLTDGVTYTFTVLAQSDVGDSKPSRRSNPVTPPRSTWKQGAMLPFPWYGYSSVARGGFLHVLGAGFSSHVAIDGTPEPWNRVESFDWRPWFSSAVFDAADHMYIYALGGLGHASDVLLATAGSDGTVSHWVPAGPPLPIPRAAHASAVYKNYLYVLGGTATIPVADVSFAQLRGDGTYAGWTQTTALPRGASWLVSLVYKNFLYAIAGEGSSDVLIATLGEDGSIKSGWRRATAQLPSGRNAPRGTVVGDNIYIGGGWKWQSFGPELGTSGVLIGRVDPATGDVTSWGNWDADAFFGPRDSFGFVANGNTLYVMGGMGAIEDGVLRLSDVQFANIDPATGHLRP
jgi:hypothetical protein